MLNHIPHSLRERASFKPDVPLPSPIRSQSPSKDTSKSKASTPINTATDGVPKSVDRSRNPKPSFAVVITSPPQRSPYKRARAEREPHGRDSSRDRTPATPNHVENSKEKINDKVSERVATHTPTPVPARSTRTAEAIPDSGARRSRRGIGQSSEGLTARDIDKLLEAVPVPFDFSLSRHHLASRKEGENDEQSEESSLWWYHPIFEARAKADIRRTLSAFLPSDPSQDPPFPVGDASGWKSEMRPRQSRASIWAERLEDAFGPGPLDRGLGRKPRRVAVSRLSSLSADPM